MNMRPADFVDETDAWRQAVASEIAARYGVAVAPEVVQRVATGASGEPMPVWNGRALVYDTEVHPMRRAIRVSCSASRAKRAPRPASEAVVARRALVADLHAQGLTDGQMMRQLGVSLPTIRNTRYDLGLPSNGALWEHNASQQRVARILDMLRRGFAPAVIAAKENVTEDTVRWNGRERLGLYWPKGAVVGIKRASPAERRAERLAAIPVLAAEGKSAREIAVLLESSPRVILRYAAALGVDLLQNRTGERLALDAVQASRRAVVLKLLREGASVYRICLTCKITRATAHADRAALIEAGQWVDAVARVAA